MGRRGRHPDPQSKRSQAALARAAALGRAAANPPNEGRTKKRTTNRAELLSALKPPADVAGRPGAAAFWKAHAVGLADAGRLRPEHVAALALLCHLHADCHELREQVAAEGRITATSKGQGISPAARLLREAQSDFLAVAREFGLTPAAETRFPPEAVEHGEEDPDEKALRAFIA